MEKIKVAIIGQGRSGRNIHGEYFKSDDNANYEVVAVVEADEFRRNNALKEYPNCKVYADYTELFGVEGIDLVVNASFSEMHYYITKDLLKRGFNVLVEKPMGRTYFECTDLIKTAKDNNVTLAVFQQSFLAPHYIHAKDVVASGKPVVDVEVSSNDAFSPFKIKLQGTRGTYSCILEDYKMKYIVDGENPERPAIYEFIKDDNGLPVYCSEQLVSHEEEGKIPGELFSVASKAFYDMLYATLTTGAPLKVIPEQAAMIVNVIATVHAQNPSPVKI